MAFEYLPHAVGAVDVQGDRSIYTLHFPEGCKMPEGFVVRLEVEAVAFCSDVRIKVTDPTSKAVYMLVEGEDYIFERWKPGDPPPSGKHAFDPITVKFLREIKISKD